MEDSALKPYPYESLPSESSIRLLVPVAKAQGSPPRIVNGHPVIEFKFEVHDLSNLPEYETLSYANCHPLQRFPEEFNHFGSDPDKHLASVAVQGHSQAPKSQFNEYSPNHQWPVIVENCVCFVSRNCYEALLQFFGPEVPDPSIDHRNPPYNKTLLISEAELGHDRAVLNLLEHGADIKAVDKFGETALHYAAENGHLETIKVLLQAGAPTDVLDSTNRTPVDCGVRCNHGPHQQEVHDLMANPGSIPVSIPFRTRPSFDRIWVDTICINSGDMAERNSQVAMMHQIYSAASRVVVWLGHSFDTPSAYLVAFITYPINSAPYAWSMREIACRSWFYRAWTTQEVASAQGMAMFLGRLEVLSLSSHIVPFLFSNNTSGLGMALRLNRQPITYRSEIEQVRTFLRVKAGIPPPEKLSWSALLVLFWDRDATDPRDKIYSTFSLARSSFPVSRVDYSRSPSDLFLEVGRALVQGADYEPNSLQSLLRIQPSELAARYDSKNPIYIGPGDIVGGPLEPLEVLGRVFDKDYGGYDRRYKHPAFPKIPQRDILPSWCPNFARTQAFPAITWNLFKAAGDTTALFHPTSDPHVLKLDGLLVDEIVEVQYDFMLAPNISQYERDIMAQVIFVFRSADKLQLRAGETWIDAFLCSVLIHTNTNTADNFRPDPLSPLTTFRHYQQKSLLTDVLNALTKYQIYECLPYIQTALSAPKYQQIHLHNTSNYHASNNIDFDMDDPNTTTNGNPTFHGANPSPSDESMTPYRIKEALRGTRMNAITRTMFRTKTGYLGMGIRYIPQPGDGVFLLKGANVPYLLRPRRRVVMGRPFWKGTGWTFAGDAFVHGIMHGEFLGDGSDSEKGVKWKAVEIY